RLQPAPWLELGMALFRTDARNDIFAVSPTGTVGLFFQNVGSTRRQGAELSARAVLDRRWELRLGYTYTEATFRDDVMLASPRITAGCAAAPCTQRVRTGSDIPLIPRQRINAGVDHHLTPWLTLWLSGAYVGSQRLRGDEENVERTLSPYVTLSAGARARWKGLTGFLTIRARAERQALLGDALAHHPGWVLSGSLCGWGDVFIPRFDLVVFVWLAPDIRLARLRAREVARYGQEAVAPGGARHAKAEAF